MGHTKQYASVLLEKLKTGHAREHAYRAPFEELIKSVCPFLTGIINDPKRSAHGAPDFVFLKSDLTVGYAETKDLGDNLDKVEKSEQMERYYGYSNIILTNYVEFRFFRNGEKWGEPIVIARLTSKTLSFHQELFSELENTLRDFLSSRPEAVRSGVMLAKIMGGKARRIRDNTLHYIAENATRNQELLRVFETIKKLLVHDITPEAFADMYAQTLVYGLFAARYNDESPETFSRQEARDLISPSNPFLRHFFDHIVGPNFDTRLSYIVDELCEVFALADVQTLMKQYYRDDLFGETHEGPDPVIHFYEDFLKEYDPALRKKIGAYYTPLPVVRFIIRAADYLLEKEFGLAGGLADPAKTEQEINRVQILDPAVGTGTFLNETIRAIHTRFKKQNQHGRWPSYVHHDLLPRLHGFELFMAPYTIAHLKLSMTLKETGFSCFNKTREGDTRLGIYLTNSLEESAIQEGTLPAFGLAQSIAEEGKEAAKIKNEKPIMVVIGNPPYSVSSQNKGEWIQNLIKDYKKELGERKINLDDDYIKFIRFAEHFIEKNGSGIVAMITNNSFLDGITHRQMRKHLLETFDDIYILDLHGNSKKKEKTPEGGKDENVFDIQQGVSINIFVRKNQDKQKIGTVYHAELFGKREQKFEALNKSDMQEIKWQKLDCAWPNHFLVPKDFGLEEEYKKGFKIDELLFTSNSGVKTDRDLLFVDIDKKELVERIQKLLSGDYDREFQTVYRIVDSSGYKLTERIKNRFFDEKIIQLIQYRPFDFQYIYYDWELLSRAGYSTNKHIFGKENICLLTSRSLPANQDFDRVFVSKYIADIHSASDQTYVFPLYLYEEHGGLYKVGDTGNISTSRIPNLDENIARKIANAIGAVYYPVAEYPTKQGDIRLTPEDIFDYIYAILHSPSYREKYKEFLKIDFPRVPYPKDKKQFQLLVRFGRELRELHLLESPKVNKLITTYPKDGSNVVEKALYKEGKVFISSGQYFGNVPEIAWNFWIGGYQPAQKWLKDRKGRTLTNADIEHYQKMIVALVETGRVMKQIDTIGFP